MSLLRKFGKELKFWEWKDRKENVRYGLQKRIESTQNNLTNYATDFTGLGEDERKVANMKHILNTTGLRLKVQQVYEMYLLFLRNERKWRWFEGYLGLPEREPLTL